MTTYFPPTLHNSTINALFNSGDFSNKTGGSLTQTTADARYIQNTGKISAITWTGTHTFSKPVSIADGDSSASNTFGGLSNIFKSNISCQAALNVGQKYFLNSQVQVTSSQNTSATFPLGEIYYIIPPTSADYNITLPSISATNFGAKIQLRIVGTGAFSVKLVPASGQFIYAFLSTGGSTSFTLYTAGSTTISSYTFYALPTPLAGTYGWFQM
jgi:hypothetical protein